MCRKNIHTYELKVKEVSLQDNCIFTILKAYLNKIVCVCVFAESYEQLMLFNTIIEFDSLVLR